MRYFLTIILILLLSSKSLYSQTDTVEKFVLFLKTGQVLKYDNQSKKDRKDWNKFKKSEIDYARIESKGKEDIYILVQKEPIFPGGDEKLREYVAQNAKYPAIAKKENVSGKVYVQFIIDKEGTVRNPFIIKGSNEQLLNDEAIRVVKTLPKFEPGEVKNQKVSVKYTLPIIFQLTKK